MHSIKPNYVHFNFSTEGEKKGILNTKQANKCFQSNYTYTILCINRYFEFICSLIGAKFTYERKKNLFILLTFSTTLQTITNEKKKKPKLSQIILVNDRHRLDSSLPSTRRALRACEGLGVKIAGPLIGTMPIVHLISKLAPQW